MTGSYNNFFRIFDLQTKKDVTLEASRENTHLKSLLKPRKVSFQTDRIATGYDVILKLLDQSNR